MPETREILFRLDAGGKTGFGHAIRSMSIAEHMAKNYGWRAVFFSAYDPELEKFYLTKGFPFYFKKDDETEALFLRNICQTHKGATILIDKLFPYTKELLAACRQWTKVVLLHSECEGMYASDSTIFPIAHLPAKVYESPGWDQTEGKLYHGPAYVIINEQVKKTVSNRNKTIEAPPYIAVTTGASDPQNILINVLKWLDESNCNLPVKALYGFDLMAKNILLNMKLKNKIAVIPFNYKDLFHAHLAICAFGVTAYELIYAQIPVITIGHSCKNAVGSDCLARRYKASYNLGKFENLNKNELISTINHFFEDSSLGNAMKSSQKKLLDGKGLERVGRILYEL